MGTIADTPIVAGDTRTASAAAPSMRVNDPIEMIFSTRLPGAYQHIMMRMTTSWLAQDPSYERMAPEERATRILDRGFETFWQTAQRMGTDIYHNAVNMEFAGRSWTYEPPSQSFKEPARRNTEAAAYLASVAGWNRSVNQEAPGQNIAENLPVPAEPARNINQQAWMNAQRRLGQGR